MHLCKAGSDKHACMVSIGDLAFEILGNRIVIWLLLFMTQASTPAWIAGTMFIVRALQDEEHTQCSKSAPDVQTAIYLSNVLSHAGIRCMNRLDIASGFHPPHT